MTGYDQKALLLTADADTTMTLEVNVDHQSGWHAYRTIDVKANTPTNYQFPSGFSAHWIRFSSAVDCKATAILTYK